MTITKTRAGELAKHARRHGYFRKDNVLWVACPECSERVETNVVHGRTVVQLLDAAVTDHLYNYCERTAS